MGPDEPLLEALLAEAQQLGFLGPAEPSWHLRHAYGFAGALGQVLGQVPERSDPARQGRPEAWWMDLGSGGGVPGLALALAQVSSGSPAASVLGQLRQLGQSVQGALLEANQRRAAFLRRAVSELTLGHYATVVEGRAEVVAHTDTWRSRVDVVWARGFGGPAVTAECAAGFLGAGGWLVVSEPPKASAGRWPEGALARLGLVLVQTVTWDGFHYAVLQMVSPCPPGYPRRDGMPAKRPLY